MAVSGQQLEYILLPELQSLCTKLGVVKGGNKPEVIARLVARGVSWDSLVIDTLKDILRSQGKTVGGNRAELIERITGSGGGGGCP